MKKVLSFILVMALVMSVSAVAFAAPSDGETWYGIDLRQIPMTEGVVAPEGVRIVALNDATYENWLKACDIVAALWNQGFDFESGFVAEGENGQLVEIVLPELRPDQKVFVNGVVIEVPENRTITVMIPAVVLITK